MMIHPCNPITWKTKTADQEFKIGPRYSELKATLVYTMLCLKNKKEKKGKEKGKKEEKKDGERKEGEWGGNNKVRKESLLCLMVPESS